MAAELVVSTDWLAGHLTDTNIRVVDMRGSVVTTQVAPGVEQADYRGARDEYLAGHIPARSTSTGRRTSSIPLSLFPSRLRLRSDSPPRWRSGASAMNSCDRR